jgi:peptide/nickel transport system substrate-binding protein
MKLTRQAVTLAALALAGSTALAACGNSTSTGSLTLGPSGAYGSVPAASGTPHAGTVTVAWPPNDAPDYIFPVTPGADYSVFTIDGFQYQMWKPLYFTTNGVSPEIVPSMSIANPPVWTDGDTKVTISLKSNWKWSDGTPVTSRDVLFWYDEMKAAVTESAANWGGYSPGLGIPDQIASVVTPNASTVVFTYKKAVNPNWAIDDQIAGIQPMPAQAWARASASGPLLNFTVPANATKIYNFLNAAAKTESTYASNSLWQTVDGPYKLTSFSTLNGAFTMKPNLAYSGPHASIWPSLKSVPFTSDFAELNAVKAKSVDVGYVPLSDLKQISSVEANGYRAFGYPTFGFDYIAYNFKDTTGDFDNIISQLYIRQALAHLEDEPGYLKAFMGGAGGLSYGPVPPLPKSAYAPADATTDPYPYSLSAATGLLSSHGWTVVAGGTDTCARPGTASDECGAGIPKGTALSWPLAYTTSPTSIGQEDQALASEASRAGIQIHLVSSNFNSLIENDNDVSSPKNDNKWAMNDFGGFASPPYPTTFGIFNITAGINVGGYTNPTANSLIEASLSSTNPDAVKAEASYLTMQQPGLFQPNPDAGMNASCVIVYTKGLSGQPTAFEDLTQFLLTPEFWYFTH